MLTANQAAVLRHLVRIDPTPSTAHDVSRHQNMAVHMAMFCLQELRRLGYAQYGRDLPGAEPAPEDREYVPTLRGMVYFRSTP